MEVFIASENWIETVLLSQVAKTYQAKRFSFPEKSVVCAWRGEFKPKMPGIRSGQNPPPFHSFCVF